MASMTELNQPQIRFLESIPVMTREGKPLIALRDPLGIFDQALILDPPTAYLVSLMDGSRTIEDLRMAYLKAFGIIPKSGEIEKLITLLDSHALLQGSHFEKQAREKARALLAQKVRPPALAGQTYPQDPQELKDFLKKLLFTPETLPRFPTIIISPHLDYQLAGQTYQQAYGVLPQPDKPLRVIILGVAHTGLTRPFSLLPLPFQTPLGTVPLDEEAVGELSQCLGEEHPVDLLAHQREHSIEMQVLCLQYQWGDQLWHLVPILVSLDPILQGYDPSLFEKMVAWLDKQLKDPHTLIVAGIDLAHRGPRYGDPKPVSEKEKAETRIGDHEILKMFQAGDSIGYLSLMRRYQATLKHCGAGVLYLLIHLSHRFWEKRAYHQTMMEDGMSMVSCATLMGY